MKKEIEEVIGLDCSNAILASAKQVSSLWFPQQARKVCAGEQPASLSGCMIAIAAA